jgi:hypothetical protein
MMSTSKNPINWKVAMAGGGLFGLGVGGFAFAGGDNNDPQWPSSVLLQETNASVVTPSRPVVIPPTTTVFDSVPAPVVTTAAPVPAPTPDTSVQPAPVAPAPVSPVVPAPVAPAPAPAPDPSMSV